MSEDGSALMRKSGEGFKAVLLALILGAAPAISAAKPEMTVVPTIAGVSVKVDGGPAGTDIENLITIAAGDPYSEKKIDAILKQVYQTGLFSDIHILKEGGNDVRLTFLLTRRLLVQNITIIGDKGLSRKKLQESLYSLRPDSVYTEEKLQRAAEELKEALRKEGYLNCVIKARREKKPAKPLVDVVFEVTAGRQLAIRSVEVAGDDVERVAALKRRMKSREGRPYIPTVLDADIGRIKDYYGTLGYPRAEIVLESPEFHEAEGTVSLGLKVIPHERIRILIQGAKVPESLVRPIWEERIFEEWGLVQSEARVLSYLRNQGYVFATAKSSIEKSAGELRIVHEVNLGRKYTINEVDFEGLHSFTPLEFKKELGLGLSFAFLGGIDGEKLFELPAQIERLYKMKGFSETQVDLNFRMVGAEMRAIYQIEEGPQQTIGRLTFNGASLFSAGALQAQIGSAEGGPFYQPNVQKDIGRLETFYLNQGVRETNVTAAVERIGESLFAVAFDISEGRRVKIERIVVTGNKATRRSTIDRELKIKEGDPASSERILETKRGLEKLGIFAEVKIEEIPISAEAEDVVINLREGERNYISLGAGLETKNETQSFEIWENGLRPRVTAELILGNMFGRASQLSFVTQSSLKETRGVISWEDRYLFGLPLQTAVNAWLEREERVSYGYDQRGISFSVIKPFAKDWVSFTMLRWASTTLYFLDVAESQVDRQHFPFSSTSISESLIRDRRDDSFNPEQGSFFSAVVEWAYPLFKAESDFLKSFVKYQRFVPLSRNLNFSATARAGLGTGWIPIHERFFGGGSNSFRGEPFDQLGPKDPSSQKPAGGKALLLFNFELRFPLFPSVPNLAGATFCDMGNVFAARSDVRIADLQGAVGLGIRYRTPLGPVRIDFGWNLHSPEERKQPIMFITIGNVF